MSFLRFSTLSVLATCKSNWPPVVGVTRTVMVPEDEQPHPGWLVAAAVVSAFASEVLLLALLLSMTLGRKGGSKPCGYTITRAVHTHSTTKRMVANL